MSNFMKDATQSWRSTVIAVAGFTLVGYLAYIKVPATDLVLVVSGVVAALGASAKDSSSK